MMTSNLDSSILTPQKPPTQPVTTRAKPAAPPLPEGCYPSLQALLHTRISEPPEFLNGLHLGEVAVLLADDPYAKTTFLLSLALTLAAGSSSPFVPEAEVASRVIYLNGDAASHRLQRQLHTMLAHSENQEEAQTNFMPLIDVHFEDERLDLSRDDHWRKLSAILTKHPPDIIFVDGVRVVAQPGKSQKASRQQAMARWKALAERLSCVVVVAQTTGKANRLRQTAVAAYAEMADTIYQLSSDGRHGSQYRLLSCEQSRWELPEAVSLRLEEQEQWYHCCPPQEETVSRNKATVEEDLAALVDEKPHADAAKRTRRVEDQVSLSQAAQLICIAQLLGWIRRTYWHKSRQSGTRGKAAKAEIVKNGTDAVQLADAA